MVEQFWRRRHRFERDVYSKFFLEFLFRRAGIIDQINDLQMDLVLQIDDLERVGCYWPRAAI